MRALGCGAGMDDSRAVVRSRDSERALVCVSMTFETGTTSRDATAGCAAAGAAFAGIPTIVLTGGIERLVPAAIARRAAGVGIGPGFAGVARFGTGAYAAAADDLTIANAKDNNQGNFLADLANALIAKQ